MALFPIAVPGLLLFVVAPLLLVVAVGVLLAIPLVLPLWLVRTVTRSRSRRRALDADGCATTAPVARRVAADPHLHART